MGNNFGISRLGPKTTAKLQKLGIQNCTDLLHHYPSRYLDFSHPMNISAVLPDNSATVTGTVLDFQNIYTRSHKNIQKAVLADRTGRLDLIWFNQPYLSKNIIIGESYTFAGTVSLYHGRPTLIAPYHLFGTGGKIIPIYPETRGLTSAWFRAIIPANLPKLLQDIEDPLPANILREFDLLPLIPSLREIHSPSSYGTLSRATRRLGLNEILSLQSLSYLTKKTWSQKTPVKIFKSNRTVEKNLRDFTGSLPFKLTPSQDSAWAEIKTDLLGFHPSNRLIQGEVGSGKTILAILACLLAHYNRSTSLLVAPTEILARQHLATFQKFLPGIPVKLLTGSSRTDFSKIAPGSVVISTHAAIYQKQAAAKTVGLLIVDEQHKFGVRQRSFLTDTLHPPHTLTMTATPIPRTVSLTLMGDLDMTVLESIPSGRPPVKTFLVPPRKYADGYRWLEQHIKKTGEQAFIVCPFIEVSETMETVKSAAALFDELKTFFPELKLELIHSRIPVEKRGQIIDDFAKNKVNILVSTPMIEVGIDFPNATTIIIESADRFGLAQLHQLRGRVGRSKLQSYCYLFSESAADKSVERLKFLERTRDGRKIALYDLKTRGPGELYSFIQHGFPSLRLSSLSDYELLTLGQKIITTLLQTDPNYDFRQLLSKSTPNINLTN